MAGSSVLVPIIVAVIGVVGALTPVIYVNNLQTRPDPDVGLNVLSTYPTREPLNNKTSGFQIYVTNEKGNAPATNLSLILNPTPHLGATAELLNITNTFSTTDVVLPQYDNTTLEPGSNKTINKSPLVIRIPKLIHGAGSIVSFFTVVNNTIPDSPSLNNSLERLRVNAVYDQGSDALVIDEKHFRIFATNLEPYPNLTKEANEFVQMAEFTVSSLFSPGLVQYYIIFFTTFGSIIYLYIRRRKTVRRFHSKVVNNIVEIRRALQEDPNNRNIFSEVWSEMPEKKRQDNHHLGDYLLIDDFYSKLKGRNLYLSKGIDKEESDLSKTNTLSRLNEALLASAENVLDKVDWNKYR